MNGYKTPILLASVAISCYLFFAPVQALANISVDPGSNYPDGTFEISGYEVGIAYYTIVGPNTGSCGFVDLGSYLTFNFATDFGVGCTQYEDTDPWIINVYTQPEENPEYLSYNLNYYWFEETPPEPGTTTDPIATETTELITYMAFWGAMIVFFLYIMNMFVK